MEWARNNPDKFYPILVRLFSKEVEVGHKSFMEDFRSSKKANKEKRKQLGAARKEEREKRRAAREQRKEN